jgi:hypothetical protein
MDRQVVVTNMINARTGVNVPEMRFRRIWERKGAKKAVPFDVLQEALYNSGVEYMFKQGILYVEDKQDRIDLGFESDEKTTADVETPVIVLTEAQQENYLTKMALWEFKKNVAALPYEQLMDLVDYAIRSGNYSFDKAEYLKELTQVDITEAVKLKKQAEE